MSRLYAISIVVFALMGFATWKMGGFSTLFMNRTEWYAQISARYDIAELSIYSSLAKTLVYVLLVIALSYWLYVKHKLSLFILIALLAIATAVENNPFSTARFQVGTILLSIYFVFPWSKNKAMVAIYALLIGLIVVFPYADLFRSSNHANLEVRIEQYRNSNPLAVKVDYDSFQQVMNAVRMVDHDGLEWGHQISSAFLFWVPRGIWPGKALPTGVLIAERSGYSFTNMSAPLWIEFFVDGGWLLLIVGFFLTVDWYGVWMVQECE